MKQLVTFFLIFLSLLCIAQDQASDDGPIDFDNYYQLYEAFLTHHGEKVDTIENSPHNQFLKESVKWLPRLSGFGHGSVSSATGALNEYNCNFNYSPSIYPNTWTELGPVGKVTDVRMGAYDGFGVGQMHRITFDPAYDGKNNFTVYGSSSFGGLWRSDTKEIFWSNANTDLQIPQTTVADIAVSYGNSDHLYIVTGDGDYGIVAGPVAYSQAGISAGGTFPTQTAGVYRSLDGGANWHPFNGPDQQLLCDEFGNGGNMRRVIANPYNPDQIIIATTEGIFKTDNARAPTGDDVIWERVIAGEREPAGGFWNTEFRGLAVKPDGIGTTVYASGSDIYKSIDGGDTWSTMTGSETGLDLNQLLPNRIWPFRINVETTSAAPDRLYATIFGRTDCPGFCLEGHQWVYIFENGQWNEVNYKADASYKSPQYRWLALAINPKNANNVYIGREKIYGNSANTTDSELFGSTFKAVTAYNSNGCHADIHDIKFTPNDNFELFTATHGGISKSAFTNFTNSGYLRTNWSSEYAGLGVSTIIDFDQSYQDPSQFITGHQDNGTIVRTGSGWRAIYGGDGALCMIDDKTNNATFSSNYFGYRNYTFKEDRPDIDEQRYRPSLPGNGYGGSSRLYTDQTSPKTGNYYFTFEELYERIADDVPPNGEGDSRDVWALRSDLFKSISIDEGNARFKWQVRQFEISERNPDVYYQLATGIDGDYPTDFLLEPHIARYDKPDCEFATGTEICHKLISTEALMPNNPGETILPLMSDLAIDPNNENRVFISFTGYDPGHKVWSFEYNPGTEDVVWTNVDPNNQLNNLPVSHIGYQKGTDDRLYIGTDAGIYVGEKDVSGLHQWAKYGDFPNVEVRNMKLNECTGTISAATFGRGLWEGDMLPATKPIENSLVISEDVTWTEDKFFKRNLILEEGVRLTINDATLFMPQGGRIIVNKKASIYLNGGTITNGCGTYWDGIQVWGDNTQPQFTGTQSHIRMRKSTVTNRRSEISNARNAISLIKPGAGIASSGGFVDAIDADFINNRRSVEIMKYIDYNNSGTAYRSRNKFNKCTFSVNDNMPQPIEGLIAHVTIWDQYQVRFYDCTFSNTRSDNHYDVRGNGIYTNDATFSVDRSSFNGFHSGIGCLIVNDPTRTINVMNTTFDNNLHGILNRGVNNISVRFNIFNVHPEINVLEDVFFGIKSEGASGLSNIQMNDFIGGPEDFVDSRGIWIEESGSEANVIMHNTFDQLKIGQVAVGDNRDVDDERIGLKYICNTYTSNFYDQFVNAGSGIGFFQGDNSKAAGNTFSRRGDESDFKNDGSNLTYFQKENSLPEELRYYSTNSISRLETPDGDCSLPGDDDCDDAFNAILVAYNINLAELINLLNNGNLLGDIKNIKVSNAASVYNTLMAASPYLGDPVLEVVVDKSDILGVTNTRNILKANPDQIRKGKIGIYIASNGKSSSLNYAGIVSEVNGTITDRTIKEAGLSRLLHDLAIVKDCYEHELQLENQEFDLAAWLNFLSLQTNRTSRIREVESYLSSNQPLLAKDKLTVYSSSYQSEISANEGLNAEVKWLNDIVIFKDQSAYDWHDLPQGAYNDVKNYAEGNSGPAALRAQNILNFFYGANYASDLNLDLVGSSSKASNPDLNDQINSKPAAKSDLVMELFPNPVSTWLGLRINSNVEKTYEFRIMDMTGKVLLQEVEFMLGERTLSIDDLKSGIYFISLYEDGRRIETHTFSKL